ncbi:MAG TPA: cell division protein FtsL [Polyangiaceae bacterium]|nr:cell division protein FtsL [Polyangiaceae bacterium]
MNLLKVFAPGWSGAASVSPRHRAAVFVTVWTLAIVATVLAFVLHLALRGRTVTLGYELGRARAEQARLREVKRVLEVESASYKTPERVEIVARTLLGMEPPTPDRMIVLPAIQERPASPASPASDGDAGIAAPNAVVASD